MRKVHDDLAKIAVDNGKLMEVGWYGLLTVIDPPPSAGYINDLKLAYYGGAQHLFASMVAFFDEDKEPTQRDLERMEKIFQELKAMEPELVLRGIKTQGSA